MENITLHNGNSAEVLKQYPDNHFDSIVTDPPYGIEFLGKDWDNNTGAIEVWQECLRVLKPGGYMLAFSAARTYHRLATNLEDIGFEIKDQIMWIYGSGFPKAQDVGKQIEKKQGKRNKAQDIPLTYGDGVKGTPKANHCSKCGAKGLGFGTHFEGKCRQDHTKKECPYLTSQLPADNEWAGWKTGLKPAHEPIVMCRKPLDNRMGKRGPMKSRLNVVENVEKWGVGALNIDATRIEFTDDVNLDNKLPSANNQFKNKNWVAEDGKVEKLEPIQEYNPQGRFPSNVIMSEEAGKELDEKTGIIKSVGGKRKKKPDYKGSSYSIHPEEGEDTGTYVDEPLKGASKYFYSPKVNRKERHWGLDMENAPRPGNTNKRKDDVAWMVGNPKAVGSSEFVPRVDANTHPTVKPVALMLYLVKLITPPNGKVLDPFNGSGSTGMAVKEFGGEYVGIDLDENYIEISRKRISAWDKK